MSSEIQDEINNRDDEPVNANPFAASAVSPVETEPFNFEEVSASPPDPVEETDGFELRVETDAEKFVRKQNELREEALAEEERRRVIAESQANLEVISPEPERSETLDMVAVRARENTVAVRLIRNMFTVNRKLNNNQLTIVAQQFNAETKAMSASKKLLDISSPKVKAIQGVMSRAYSCWKSFSTPYPETGIRLLRRDRTAKFEEEMTGLKAELETAKLELDADYESILDKARGTLGALFNRNDYPASLSAAYDISWEYPSFEPPQWMRQVHPELYEKQMQLISKRFEVAITNTEEMFAEEFAKIVDHFATRLGKDSETGEYLSIQGSNITKVQEFIGKFRELNFGGNDSLSSLIERAEELVSGKSIDSVRKNVIVREELAESMRKLREDMDGVIVATTRQISLDDDE